MSELITTSSAYIINGDSPMTSVANTVAMTSFAVHTLQPLIFYRLWAHSPRRNWSATPSLTLLTFAAWLGEHTSRIKHLSIKEGYEHHDITVENIYKEVLESVDQGTFTLSTQSANSDINTDRRTSQSRWM